MTIKQIYNEVCRECKQFVGNKYKTTFSIGSYNNISICVFFHLNDENGTTKYINILNGVKTLEEFYSLIADIKEFEKANK